MWYPWSSQSFPKERTAGVSSRSITLTSKSNCLTCTVASSLVCTSPLAVITVVGILDVLMVSNSAELRSRSLTICILAPESSTNSLSSGSFVDVAGSTPCFRGRVECSLVFLIELVYVFGKIPSFASGTSLLSFSLFMGLVLKFHSVGTSMMGNFDIYIFPTMILSQDANFTKRSRAGTFQIVSTRLSKNDTRITIALDTSFPRHTSISCRWWLRRCGGIWVRFLLCTIVTRMPETALVSLRTLAFLFPLITSTFSSFNATQSLSTHDHCSCSPFSRVWRQSFVNAVSDLYSFSPLSSTFDFGASISSDDSPCRTIPMRFWVARTHVFFICTDLPRHHRMEFLTLIVELRPSLYRIPEHCRHEGQQRINQHNPILCHERQLLENSR